SLKLKGRSNSSPLPLSALDFIPVSEDDVFVPIPFVVRNYFDEMLPRELQLQVFSALIALHERDHLRTIARGSWTVIKASSSKNRWVGKERGVRELVKLSRVSKSWKALVFDGQLWNALGLRPLPGMHKSQLLALSDIGGHFSTSLNFAGHVHLNTLSDITEKLCLTSPLSIPSASTQLTSVNLRGCINLTSRSLHHLLVRSPMLEKLCLKGLNVVTNTTCDILAMYCPRITVLDLSRCLNMDAEGIQRLASAFKARGDRLLLKELRLSGLKKVDDKMMATLGAVTPFLEVLDLSYSRKLHNSALDAFVALDEDQEIGDDVETVLLTSSELGRDLSDSTRYRRRVTRLRHLSLTSCVLLTDQACSNLVHAVPQLELLELADIGEDLKDDGLVRLLSTTPLIRKLDLEDAGDITDSVLAAVTPTQEDPEETSTIPSTSLVEPGQALEHLVISYASNIGDDALLTLVRRCRRLTVLEADNTRIGPEVLREFVTLCRLRKLDNAKIVAVDCRMINDGLVREMIPMTRPRLGLRTWDTRKLRYLDARDFEESDAIMKAAHGQDELDEKRVVIKTFYSWQGVDIVWAARDKRRKANAKRRANESSGGNETDGEEASGSGRGSGGGTRWWSPGGRRSRPSSGTNSPPAFPELNSDGQCVIM
ncbi:RNI-like protein, partial [Dendrothele bispora CBS 962.96]